MNTHTEPDETLHLSDAELVALLGAGASMQLMAAASRTSTKRVMERLRVNGAELKNGYRFQFRSRERDEVAKLLRAWYESGATLRDLMRSMGMDYPKALLLLKESGTTLRPPGKR